MTYKVNDTLQINGNTVVSILGNGKGLRNGIYVKNEKGVNYYIISVGTCRMMNGEIPNSTDLLIDGSFKGKNISLL